MTRFRETGGTPGPVTPKSRIVWQHRSFLRTANRKPHHSESPTGHPASFSSSAPRECRPTLAAHLAPTRAQQRSSSEEKDWNRLGAQLVLVLMTMTTVIDSRACPMLRRRPSAPSRRTTSHLLPPPQQIPIHHQTRLRPVRPALRYSSDPKGHRFDPGTRAASHSLGRSTRAQRSAQLVNAESKSAARVGRPMSPRQVNDCGRPWIARGIVTRHADIHSKWQSSPLRISQTLAVSPRLGLADDRVLESSPASYLDRGKTLAARRHRRRRRRRLWRFLVR